MIKRRSAVERPQVRCRDGQAIVTAYSNERSAANADGLGTLQMIRLPPGAGVPPQPHLGDEVVTFVREGALAYEDSSGRLDIIHAGEFSRITGARTLLSRETNASRTVWAHVFQIGLGRLGPTREPNREQRRFSAAERRGKLCLIASQDGREGALRIHRDALVYSTIVSRGRRVVHALQPGRYASLHVVAGELKLGDIVVTTGEGVAIEAERAVSFTASEDSEVLLLHFGDQLLPARGNAS